MDSKPDVAPLSSPVVPVAPGRHISIKELKRKRRFGTATQDELETLRKHQAELKRAERAKAKAVHREPEPAPPAAPEQLAEPTDINPDLDRLRRKVEDRSIPERERVSYSSQLTRLLKLREPGPGRKAASKSKRPPWNELTPAQKSWCRVLTLEALQLSPDDPRFKEMSQLQFDQTVQQFYEQTPFRVWTWTNF